MMDKVSLVIDMTPKQRQRIEEQAHQRGFAEAGDYLLALVASDAQADDDLTKEELLANLRQSLLEVKRGEVYPVESLWDGLDDE